MSLAHPKQLDYSGLSAFIYPSVFEVRKGNETIETIKIPSKFKKFYKDAAHRDLVVLDYLDRLAGDSEITSDSDLLKKFAVSLNRELKGLLFLDSLSDEEIKISGITIRTEKLGPRKYLKVTAGKVSRLMPCDLDITLRLLLPIFAVASLKRRAKDPCCGGEKKSR